MTALRGQDRGETYSFQLFHSPCDVHYGCINNLNISFSSSRRLKRRYRLLIYTSGKFQDNLVLRESRLYDVLLPMRNI